MIKLLIAAPFALIGGLVVAFWVAVAIGSVVVLAFILSPVLTYLDKYLNLSDSPSKYYDYGKYSSTKH